MKALRIILTAILLGATGWMMIRDIQSRQYFSLRVKVSPEQPKNLGELEKRQFGSASFNQFLKDRGWSVNLQPSGWSYDGNKAVVEQTEDWIKAWNINEKSRLELVKDSKEEAFDSHQQKKELLEAELKTRQQWIDQLQGRIDHWDFPECSVTPIRAPEVLSTSIADASVESVAEPQVQSPSGPVKSLEVSTSEIFENNAPMLSANVTEFNHDEKLASTNVMATDEIDSLLDVVLPTDSQVTPTDETPLSANVIENISMGTANILSSANSFVALSSANILSSANSIVASTNINSSANIMVSQQHTPVATPQNTSSLELVNIVKKSIADVKLELNNNRNHDREQIQQLTQVIDQQQDQTSKILAAQEHKMLGWIESEFSKLQTVNSWNARQWQSQIQMAINELKLQQSKLKRELELFNTSNAVTPIEFKVSYENIELPIKEWRHGYRFLLLGLAFSFIFNLVWEVIHSRRSL